MNIIKKAKQTTKKRKMVMNPKKASVKLKQITPILTVVAMPFIVCGGYTGIACHNIYAESAGSRTTDMDEAWQQVVEKMFSAFTENGRDYLEMPIGEMTRVLEARGFSGGMDEGAEASVSAYSGTAHYTLDAGDKTLLTIRVHHGSAEEQAGERALCRQVQINYSENCYNENVLHTLSAVDAPGAIYFGANRAQVMKNLGITGAMMDNYRVSAENFDMRSFVVSSHENTVYTVINIDGKDGIVVGKNDTIFAISFRGDETVDMIYFAKVKYADELEALETVGGVCSSWMYLDGYPLDELPFDEFKAYLNCIGLSQHGADDDAMLYFTEDDASPAIMITKDDQGEEMDSLFFDLDNDELFVLQAGIPQGLLQVLEDTPDGMTQENYILDLLGNPDVYVSDDGSAEVLQGMYDGRFFSFVFRDGQLSTTQEMDDTGCIKKTPRGGLAEAYLKGLAVGRMVYEEVLDDFSDIDENGIGYEGCIGGHRNGENLDWYIYGNGTYYYDGGDYYTGGWTASNRQGTGSYYWAEDDRTFVGQWSAGARNGVGVVYDENQNIEHSGIWFNGAQIGIFE